MFKGLFRTPFGRGKTVTVPVVSSRVPDETVVWAVGDVHGRLDLLAPLLESILSDLTASAASRKVLVFLGDYVDRGPQSQGVIDLLCRVAEAPGLESHFLRGNHEDRLEAFLTDPTVGPGWCDYGGREALRSWGVTACMLREDVEGWAETSKAFAAAVTEEQRGFFRDQKMHVSVGDYFFCHAGARPGIDLDDQSSDDLMWIRQGFLDDDRAWDRVVVHGHTPAEQVHSDHRRIGIDTGAYATGVLTGLRLEGTERRVVQAIVRSGGITVTAA